MIRAVLFDLDGTLYDRDASVHRLAEAQFDAFRDDVKGIDLTRFVARIVELDSHGHNIMPRLYHRLADDLGLDPGVGGRLEAYFVANYHRHCRVSPDTLATLDALRAHGTKLGMITNGPTEWQNRKLDALGIRPYFDTILISEAEGIQKPDPRIFARALDRCGVPASEAIFVGDHPDADIAGAQAAGLRPVWKRVPYWTVGDDVLSVDALSELLPLCLGE